MLFGMTISVIGMSANAYCSIVSMLSGRCSEARLVHPPNHDSLMILMPSGMLIDSSRVQNWNA